MASSKEYMDFIIEQLSELEDNTISFRNMMGEYILYYKDRIAGGVYDNRLLIKNVQSAKKIIKDVVYEIPYKGAKKMILISDVEDKIFLKKLFEEIYDELPVGKAPKAKQQNMSI